MKAIDFFIFSTQPFWLNFLEVVQNYHIYKNGTKVNSTVSAHTYFIHILNNKRYSNYRIMYKD